MLDAIRQFFEREIGAEREQGSSSERRLQVATAALLLEMTRMDSRIEAAEQQAVEAAVQRCFGLSAEATAEILRLAGDEARHATDYYQFTSLINRSFSAEQKQQVVEYLWRVAYADGNLDRYEAHLVRKIADLLYVPHAAYIAAKLRAREHAAGAG